jgi:hypothetical protein
MRRIVTLLNTRVRPMAANPRRASLSTGNAPRIPQSCNSDAVVQMVNCGGFAACFSSFRAASTQTRFQKKLAEGPLPANEINESAKAAGLSWRSVRRANPAATLPGISPYHRAVTVSTSANVRPCLLLSCWKGLVMIPTTTRRRMGK